MFLLPSFLSVIALGFLFAPMFVLSFKDKTAEIQKWTNIVNIIDYFKNYQTFHFTFIIFLVLVLVGIITSFFVKKVKPLGFISFFSFMIGLCLFFSQGLFYTYNHVYAYKEAYLAWGGMTTAILLSLATFVEFIIAYRQEKMSIRDIAEDGMLIAMAFVLNFVKIPVGATGGSINLQFFPLFLIALRHGAMDGLVCASVVYGLISCLADGYPISTYPFDYFIAFAGVAFFGVFRSLILNGEKMYNLKGILYIVLAGVLALLTRWFGSTLSSVLNYNVTFVEGLAYNIPYVFFSGIAATILMVVLYGPIMQLDKVLNKKSRFNEESQN